VRTDRLVSLICDLSRLLTAAYCCLRSQGQRENERSVLAGYVPTSRNATDRQGRAGKLSLTLEREEHL
jgi:hypothetical protein